MRKTRISTTFDMMMKINTCRYFYFLLFLFLSSHWCHHDSILFRILTHVVCFVTLTYPLFSSTMATLLLKCSCLIYKCYDSVRGKLFWKNWVLYKRKREKKTINIPQSMNSKNMRRSCKSIYFYTREDPNKRSIIVTSCYSSSSSHSMYI